MAEQFESIKDRIEALLPSSERENRRSRELEKFLDSCIKMSDLIGSEISGSGHTPAHTNWSEKEREFKSIKCHIDVMNDVIGELSRKNGEMLSEVEKKLKNIVG